MKGTSTLRIHQTKAGGVSGPVMGRFSSKAVLQFGASLLVGLLVSIIAGSLIIGAVVPMVTFALLFALSGKPEGYVFDWMEWQWIKSRGAGLFEWKFLDSDHDDD